MGENTTPIVVMGVQGAGKSTLGQLLAERLGYRFVDGDDLHTPENVAAMAAGRALTDAQREPWLRTVGSTLSAGADDGIVVACSALKQRYRDLLRESVPGLFVVHPAGSMQLVAERIGQRSHQYMPAALLQSQFDTLEPLAAGERGVTIDIARTPQELVEAVIAALGAATAATGTLATGTLATGTRTERVGADL